MGHNEQGEKKKAKRTRKHTTARNRPLNQAQTRVKKRDKKIRMTQPKFKGPEIQTFYHGLP